MITFTRINLPQV